MSEVSTRMELVSADEARQALAEGASVSQWVFDKPDLDWSARRLQSVLVACNDAFERLAQRFPQAQDAELRAKVVQEVDRAAEVATANNTRRAFETLLCATSSPKVKRLVRTFLDLRVRVEDGELTEARAAELAAEARLAL